MKLVLLLIGSSLFFWSCAPQYRCGYDRNLGMYPHCGLNSDSKGKGEKAPTGTTYSGYISYYGDGFDGKSTASGETFDSGDLTCAHRTLSFGTRLKVTLKSSQKSVVVRVNDRGPYKDDRILDLSEQAAEEIGLTQKGIGIADIEVIE
jgi:rare lipoprotein A